MSGPSVMDFLHSHRQPAGGLETPDEELASGLSLALSWSPKRPRSQPALLSHPCHSIKEKLAKYNCTYCRRRRHSPNPNMDWPMA